MKSGNEPFIPIKVEPFVQVNGPETKSSSNQMKCNNLWENLGESGRIWENLGESGKLVEHS